MSMFLDIKSIFRDIISIFRDIKSIYRESYLNFPDIHCKKDLIFNFLHALPVIQAKYCLLNLQKFAQCHH